MTFDVRDVSVPRGRVPNARPAREIRLQAARECLDLLARWRLRLLGVLLVLVAGWLTAKGLVAYHAYHAALRDAHELSAYQDRDPASISPADAAIIGDHCRALRADLERLGWATSLPVGSGLIEHLPVVGARYRAGRALIQTGLLLSAAGETAAQVGQQVLAAYAATGFYADQAPASPTWLDVLVQHEPQLLGVADEVALATETRVSIHANALPDGARAYLDDLDSGLAKLDVDRLVHRDLPVTRLALGADQPARYIVLFQNPTELRPSGGFPGTMAYVELDRGQLRHYEIYDIREVSDDYIAKHLTAYPQPWPIQQYFPSSELIFHDANWWADFPHSADQLARMWAETGRPSLSGVVAVQPEIISAMLRFTGPLDVAFEGDARLITPDNVLDEIERERRLHREGLQADENHKQLLAVIGTDIVETLKSADKSTLRQIGDALQSQADRRNAQLWMADSTGEAWLDEHGWSGRIIPDPAQPTMALVLANVVTNKASLRLLPSAHLTFGPVRDGRRTVTLQVYYKNTGTNEEDPFYAGFARWWTELYLPAGSLWVRSFPDPLPNPEAPDGGSYLIATFPQETGYLSITFSMPDDPSLLLRRQPGLVPLDVSISIAGCAAAQHFSLQADVVLALNGVCP